MSTEQSESAHSQAETKTAHSQVDITQQATTTNPTTTQQRAKNPKRVAAGKLVAERTRRAREQQKKALDEASIIIANNNKAKAADPEPTPTISDETPNSTVEKNSSLSTTQWLAVASLVVSLIGIYYKREELKAVFNKKTPEPAHAETQPPRVTQTRGVKHLD